MKTISFIIPVYNSEKTISKCIASIQRQTYKNIEIICVNDRSTDNSLSILQSLKIKDNRIKVISQKNQGPFIARKQGILSASGDYTMFVDADDKICNKNAAKAILDTFTNHKVELVQFSFYSYHGQYIKKRHRNSVLGNISLKDLKRKYYFDYLSSEGKGVFNVILWNKAYITALLKDSVANFNTNLRFGEDLLLLLRYISDYRFHSMYNIDFCLYSYYTGIGISSSFDENIMDSYGELKKTQMNLCDKWSLCEDAKYYCNLESIYFLFGIVKCMIDNKKDKHSILDYINKSNSFECIKIAKHFFRCDYSKGLYEELHFLTSNYSPEQYYQYTIQHNHNKESFVNKMKDRIKVLLRFI